ncbi:threonine--tRNA ligase [Vulgatibacter incomptus]|uniref:Threonine--tRNA ligase n=1 Tax=Vulgatibacter incomptus TaxID=1391653 RepID=A0A0K1PBN0_9BACT|nr:threonine--tRNA ligase [Vulgatibacter incomptus]AKU90529.1 Threonyl-tRNA synthetase [Vulgatibacter incomptus]
MVGSVQVTLPDGSVKTAARGTTVADFVREAIGPGLAKAALAAKLDGRPVDLTRKIEDDARLEVITAKSDEGLEVIRHSSAHIVASAVQRIHPDAEVTIGPVIEDGFYYDFFFPRGFTPEDLEKFEAEIAKIVAEDSPFERTDVPIDDAIALFLEMGEKFKVEIIEDLKAKGETTVGLYRHAGWTDLCRGPHLPSTGKAPAIKLMSVAGAYWRGDSTKPQLQRIYGTSWRNKKELDEYLVRLEEAKKRDHRKLGRELDLFAFHPFAPGAAFWTDKGTTIFRLLGEAMRTLVIRNGYQEIKTPLLYNKGLWETSGHWGKYKENMFLVLDSETGEHDMSLKPMNCPSHHLFFGMKRHSYRELPLRFHTQDVLHRNEPSGSLGGLTRVRQFQQDDAHIYLAESQITDEVVRLVNLLDRCYDAFGLTYEAMLSTRPAERLGDDATWDRAEAGLRNALEVMGLPYRVNEGDGAFYGPKIDFVVSDSIGRKWQLGTIQLDYLAPERFDLTFVGEDNQPHRPVVIHRAIFGSFERFIAICIEHFAGAFPAWLAPVQARIVTVSDRQLPWARQVWERMREAGLRVELDERSEKLGAKIRDAQLEKIPYALVVGDQEVEKQGISPRRLGGENLEFHPVDAFIQRLKEEGRIPFLLDENRKAESGSNAKAG